MAQKWSYDCQKRSPSTSFLILFHSDILITTTRLPSLSHSSKSLKWIHKSRKNGLNGCCCCCCLSANSNQQTGSAIPNQKTLDVFQRTVISFRDPVDTDSKEKSLAPTYISRLFRRKKQAFQFGGLNSTQKRIFWQKWAINPSEGNGAPNTRQGHRQRRQGKALSGSRGRPPSWVSPSATRPDGG